MKIAITGASGKTGFRITEEAVKKGYKVRQIIRKNSRVSEGLESLETIRVSLENKKELDKAFEGINGIYKYIKFLGLSNQKSKNIYNLSKLLIEKHNGTVPDSFEKLESLPGVGHKTASVVMSQVFKIPSFPVDTHIHRLAQRWGLSNGDSVVQTEKDLKKIFPINDWNTLHLQIIFYGREYCTARGCDGTKCFLCRTLYPKRKKKFICKKP